MDGVSCTLFNYGQECDTQASIEEPAIEATMLQFSCLGSDVASNYAPQITSVFCPELFPPEETHIELSIVMCNLETLMFFPEPVIKCPASQDAEFPWFSLISTEFEGIWCFLARTKQPARPGSNIWNRCPIQTMCHIYSSWY